MSNSVHSVPNLDKMLLFFGITPSGNPFKDMLAIISKDFNQNELFKQISSSIFNFYDKNGDGKIDVSTSISMVFIL